MVVKISDLKRKLLVMRFLRWDVTPEFLFKPRFTGMGKERDLQKETEGYMFYIDHINGVAKLMLMRTIQLMSTSEAEIEGVPQDMLLRAVKAEGVKPMAGMYPISKELEQWLKKELGIKAPETKEAGVTP